MEVRFDIKIEYNKAKFKGCRNIYLTNVICKTKAGIIFFNADSISIGVKPFALLINKFRLANISIYNSKTVFDFELYTHLKTQGINKLISDTTGAEHTNYIETFKRIQKRISDYMPGKIILRNTSFYFYHDTINAGVTFENLSLKKNKFVSDILFTDNNLSNECLVQGKIIPSLDEFALKIIHPEGQNIKFPYLGPRWQACFGFDTLILSGKLNKSEDNCITISGVASGDKLSIYHNQIGPDTVITTSGKINYICNIGKNYIELDSTSVININNFSFSPYLRYEKSKS